MQVGATGEDEIELIEQVILGGAGQREGLVLDDVGYEVDDDEQRHEALQHVGPVDLAAAGAEYVELGKAQLLQAALGCEDGLIHSFDPLGALRFRLDPEVVGAP